MTEKVRSIISDLENFKGDYQVIRHIPGQGTEIEWARRPPKEREELRILKLIAEKLGVDIHGL